MKKRFFKFVYLVIFGIGLFSYSCVDMNVENYNSPDMGDVLATPSDLIKVAGGAYRVWFLAINAYSGPAMAMNTMADQSSCSWGNCGMKDLSSEPRKPFNNDITYSYAYVNRDFWNGSYSALSQVNDVLSQIDGEDVKIIDAGNDVTNMIRAWCYFMQGVVHGYLGLIIDQANIIDWDTDLSQLEFKPYQDVSAAAMGFFDKALSTLANTDDFVLPDNFILGTNLTKEQFTQLVNSFAARVMVYTPRTAAENAAVDWGKVLTYAQNGITYDLDINMDNNTWWDDYKWTGINPGWARIDHRIINLMDHAYPSRWPDDNVSWNTDDGLDPGEASSDDGRLASDFQYLSENNFRPERGYYHFSHYRYKRYDDYMAANWLGYIHTFLRWENDMFIAEALVRANHDVNGAAAILNDANGARKLRGGLDDVAPATDEQALELIFYERDVELILSQGGIAYFDMRRRDMLQAGTPLHFPVPAAELEILGLPNYTTDGPDDLSTGCWKGYDGLVSPVGATCDK